jgi:8-oxo-dGTP pyrophosphatase MutT (NUDIX family)
VEPREAATVVLLRPATDGFEVFLQRRPPTMAFAAGMTVFPGGAREPADVDLRDTAVRETEEETGVRLAPADLLPWARWITPEGEPRRFDAWFFVAELPAGQSPEARGTEMDVVSWLAPGVALDRFAAGELPMWPPTVTTLRELAGCLDIAAVRVAAAEREVVAVQPVLSVEEDGSVTVRLPDGTVIGRPAGPGAPAGAS